MSSRKQFIYCLITFILLCSSSTVADAGSLYKEGGWGDELYADVTAHKEGDLVTVLIVQNSSARQNTETEKEKSASISADVDVKAGTGFLDFIRNGGGSAKAGRESRRSGSRSVERRTNLIANVTAEVVEVLENSNLRVEGRQHTVINNDELEIFVTGIIRRVDIAPDNTILSTAIADAQIEYRDPMKPKDKRHFLIRGVLFPFKLVQAAVVWFF